MATGTRANPGDVYTKEQLATLDELKHPEYALGIAYGKHVNEVLMPDGTLTKDLKSIRTNLVAWVSDKKMAASKAIPTDVDNAEQVAAFKKASDEYRTARDRAEEFEEHLRQKRFLFIPADDTLTYFVYFQTAVEGNPDLPPLLADLDDDHPDKITALARLERRAEAAKTKATKVDTRG